MKHRAPKKVSGHFRKYECHFINQNVLFIKKKKKGNKCIFQQKVLGSNTIRNRHICWTPFG